MLKFLQIFFVICAVNAKLRFDNYTLYRISPSNAEQLKVLQNLRDSDFRFDFWSEPAPNRKHVDILSSPKSKADLENILNGNGISYGIAMSNIQEAIDKEKVGRDSRSNTRSMTWDRYYTNDEINSWMDSLIAADPSRVSAVIGGTSFENRPIRGIRISFGSGRRIIFLEGGIHSREWISPAVVCYITSEVLHSEDENTRRYVEQFDWHIFPVTNPDGYIFSHEEDRMWRKNRRPIGDNFGVDLNRNWNNNWMVFGASANPATNNYAGIGPFSEPETRHLSNYIRSIGDRIDIYLSFHSFGKMLLIPFGNSTAAYANYYDTLNIGRRAMGALSVRYGTQYVTGNIAEAIYQATGGSIDWVKGSVQVPIVYCYELRPQDWNSGGFFLPPEQILPTGEETMDSIVELIHQAKRFNVISGSNGLTTSVVLILLGLITAAF